MTEFENKIYNDAERLAIMEHRAAELERLLLLVMRPDGDAYPNVAVPEGDERRAFKGGGSGGGATAAAGGRTEALINRGRPGARRRGAAAARALAAGHGRGGRAARRGRRGPGGDARFGGGLAGQRGDGPGGDQAGLREPRCGGRARRAELRLRRGHQPGAVGVRAAHQRGQPELRGPVNRPRGAGAGAASAGRRHRLVPQPASPVRPRQPDRQPRRRRAGDQQHHQRRRPDLLDREGADRAGPGEQGGELPAVHRLGEAGHQGGLPGRLRVTGHQRIQAGGAGERRVPAVDGRRPVPHRERGRGAVRRTPTIPAAPRSGPFSPACPPPAGNGQAPGTGSERGREGTDEHRQEGMVAAGDGACHRERQRRDHRVQLRSERGDADHASRCAAASACARAGGAARHGWAGNRQRRAPAGRDRQRRPLLPQARADQVAGPGRGADLGRGQQRRRRPRALLRRVRQSHPRTRRPGDGAAQLGHRGNHLSLAAAGLGGRAGGHQPGLPADHLRGDRRAGPRALASARRRLHPPARRLGRLRRARRGRHQLLRRRPCHHRRRLAARPHHQRPLLGRAVRGPGHRRLRR